MKQKLKEWGRRYIPAEILGTIMALICSFAVFGLTGNLIATAYAGTIGENTGYYGFMSAREIIRSRRHHKANNKEYTIISFLKNIRNLMMEFGLSEVFDSILIRPFFMYLFPTLLGNITWGILAGKVAADIIFYAPTIIAYELRKKHLGE